MVIDDWMVILMNETHVDHYSNKPEQRLQEAKTIIVAIQSCPVMAEELMVKRLASERRRVWRRAIKTLEWYVGERPIPPAHRQMEYGEDFDTRVIEHQRKLDAYFHAKGFVNILKERFELEEPPEEETDAVY